MYEIAEMVDEDFHDYEQHKLFLLNKFSELKSMNETLNIYKDGESLLAALILNFNEKIALDLVKQGADPNTSSKGGEPVLILANEGQMHNLTLELLERGANPNGKSSIDGRTALHAPIQYMQENPANKFTVLRSLIRNGANPNMRNNDNETPLMTAIEEYNEVMALEMIKFLIRKNATIGVSDNKGELALHHALKRKYPEVALHLIEKGSDVNHYNKEGSTPLHLAIESDLPQVVLELIKKGGDLLAKNGDGKMPSELVTETSNSIIKKELNWHNKKEWLKMHTTLKKRAQSTSQSPRSTKRQKNSPSQAAKSVLTDPFMTRHISTFMGGRTKKQRRKFRLHI